MDISNLPKIWHKCFFLFRLYQTRMELEFFIRLFAEIIVPNRRDYILYKNAIEVV